MIEEYVLPWRYIPRSTSHKKWLITVCTSALYLAVVFALYDWATKTTAFNSNIAIQGYLFIVPLIAVIIWQLFLTIKPTRYPIPSLSHIPSERYTHIIDDEMIILKIPFKPLKLSNTGLRYYFEVLGMAVTSIFILIFTNVWAYLLVGLPIIAMYNFDWDTTALVMFIFYNIIASIGMASFLPFLRKFSSEVIQVKARHIRTGLPLFGAVFADGDWRTRPPARLFNYGEQQWFKNILNLR